MKFHRLKVAVIFATMASLSGCATLDKLAFWKSEKTPPAVNAQEPALAAENVKSSSVQELELKNAKLWTRVDELEEQVAKQRVRIKVLERGLILGILPDELKDDGGLGESRSKKKPVQKSSSATKAQVPHDSNSENASAVLMQELAQLQAEESKKAAAHNPEDAAKPKVAIVSDSAAAPAKEASDTAQSAENANAGSRLSPKEQEEYKKLLASAHDHYRAGRYGKAVVEFSEIGRVYGDLVEGGVHRFWVARSWSGLKEYQTARQMYGDFLKDFPGSPWAPRAKVELARIEFQMGFKEKAMQRLREVIQTHPYEDAAEMAKMELNNFQKAL